MAAVVNEPEKLLVIIEIKGTDWNKIRGDRIARNVRAHLRQLQGYLDTAIDDLESGQWDSVVGALLYGHRPNDQRRTDLIEAVAAE